MEPFCYACAGKCNESCFWATLHQVNQWRPSQQLPCWDWPNSKGIERDFRHEHGRETFQKYLRVKSRYFSSVVFLRFAVWIYFMCALFLRSLSYFYYSLYCFTDLLAGQLSTLLVIHYWNKYQLSEIHQTYRTLRIQLSHCTVECQLIC